eukprot:1405663-Lingulodinium_polyedra.AAC.1
MAAPEAPRNKKKFPDEPGLPGTKRRVKVSEGTPEAFSAAADLPEGPTSVQQLLDFVPRIAERLFDVEETLPRFLDTLSKGVLVSTDYSGIDAPLIAMARIANYFKVRNFPKEFRYEHYSSCELQP